MAQIYKKTKRGQIEKKTNTHILLSSLRSTQNIAEIDKKTKNGQIDKYLGFPEAIKILLK